MDSDQALDFWLSFEDLKRAGIVGNWPTLREWQRDQGFPAGKLLGPNSRRWRKSEIEEWLASRPEHREAEIA